MEPQTSKACKTLNFTIARRTTEAPLKLVSQEVSFSGSSTYLELSNCCRLCLEEPHPNQMLDMTVIYDQEAVLSYYDCYEICTKEDLRQNPKNEPRTLCKRCAVELQWAYDFHKKVAIANQQLREIFGATEANGDTEQEEDEEDEADMSEEFFVEEIDERQDDQEMVETPDTAQSLEDIVPRHRYSGKFNCTFCQKEFRNHSRMAKHQLIHLDNRPSFRCNQCDRVYLTKQALKVHVDSKHRQSGLHCDMCGKVFAIAKALEIHKRYHTRDFPYSCDLCDRRFAQRSHLTVHQQVKHSGSRFICEFPGCQKSFTSSSSLRNHECTHTAMPFECAHCQQSYPARNKLRLHLERKHNMVVQMEDLEEMRKFHIVRSKLVMAKIYSDQNESDSARNDNAAVSK
ncbi:zinc finger protein 32 isoform X1 [Drosophila teissieri]|uniref:zinc finger protein 32 isoform X1 n=2 Tax=Drosophila teissieri TaxID=7243 RepID=UPI001CBA1431|nr:zinc finger protein 32 isoform X1 [Drosophila teissieri]XP_043652671.1 zinc finger protein 32 isoform X1 [Drosophila teissieri]